MVKNPLSIVHPIMMILDIITTKRYDFKALITLFAMVHVPALYDLLTLKCNSILVGAF